MSTPREEGCVTMASCLAAAAASACRACNGHDTGQADVSSLISLSQEMEKGTEKQGSSLSFFPSNQPNLFSLGPLMAPKRRTVSHSARNLGRHLYLFPGRPREKNTKCWQFQVALSDSHLLLRGKKEKPSEMALVQIMPL